MAQPVRLEKQADSVASLSQQWIHNAGFKHPRAFERTVNLNSDLEVKLNVIILVNTEKKTIEHNYSKTFILKQELESLSR